MKSYDRSKSRCPIPFVLRMIGGIAVLCSLVISLQMTANAASISGESETIFRMQKIDDRNLYPLYEYLRLSGSGDLRERGTFRSMRAAGDATTCRTGALTRIPMETCSTAMSVTGATRTTY